MRLGTVAAGVALALFSAGLLVGVDVGVRLATAHTPVVPRTCEHGLVRSSTHHPMMTRCEYVVGKRRV